LSAFSLHNEEKVSPEREVRKHSPAGIKDLYLLPLTKGNIHVFFFDFSSVWVEGWPVKSKDKPFEATFNNFAFTLYH